MYIKDASKLVETIERFSEYIRFRDNFSTEDMNWTIRFRDSASFLGREEAYKIPVAERARFALRYGEWNEEWIGTGRISTHVIEALNHSSNLVFFNTKADLKKLLNSSRREQRIDAERVLYNIYRGTDDRAAFSDAVKVFGGKYALIAFLFFVKDYTKYLPISPKNMDESFSLLEIGFKTSYSCNWENYCEYLALIREIRDVMAEALKMGAELWLIDAHSFVWIIHERTFRNWRPTKVQEMLIEKATEATLDRLTERKPRRKQIVSSSFVRNAEIAKNAKLLANGVCQLCNRPAPFIGRDGYPYLEAHHIVWLSRGGTDSPDNVVALCPNCHTKMHVVDDEKDIVILKNVLS